MPATLTMMPRPDTRASDQVAPRSFLDVEVRSIMTPGVVTIAETASVREAFGALAAHRVHSVLVVGHSTGTPLGWVTVRGLLG